MNSPAIISLSDLATKINLEHHAADQAALKGLSHAWQAGRFLLSAKSAVGHGGWADWVKANCTFSYRTARVYTQLAMKVPSLDDPKWQHAANLPLREVLALLADPKPNKIAIDPEFSTMLPPLRQEEFRRLEASILKEGCRDALVVWDGILIDGHQRYEICTRHGIQFKVMEMCFADRDAAADWIDANQLSRCNLSPDAYKFLLGRHHNRAMKRKTA